MADVHFVSLNRSKAKRKPAAVKAKRVRDASGAFVTLHTVNIDSPTLAEDLSYVFRKNVAKARRENRRLFGSSDRVKPKG